MKKYIVFLSAVMMMILFSGTLCAQNNAAGPEYAPRSYKNEAFFEKAFSNVTALNNAAKALTDVRTEFLQEIFAWLAFLEEANYLPKGIRPRSWEQADLSRLPEQQFARLELLSVQAYQILQPPVQAIESSPKMQGRRFRTGTPLDMGRPGVQLTKTGQSYCTALFKEAGFDKAALHIWDLVNLELDSISGKIDDSTRTSRELDIRMKYR